MSPTQRTMAYLREKGAHPAIVEHWNHYAQIHLDLYNWIDVLAISEGRFLGVQTTTQANASARMDKARGNAALKAWLEAGGQLAIHCWAKRGERGRRKLWTLKEQFLSAEDLV